MTDSGATDAPNVSPPGLQRLLFCVVCAIGIGMLFLGAEPGISVLKNTDAKDCYYNLLIQGFREGHLNIKTDVPPGLTQLANPYDPAANAPYIQEVGDMSYYKGKLYLYFGVTPALVLYWPFLIVTGHYLQDAWAGLIFCSIGFLIGAGLLYSIWRRYFLRVPMWVAMAGIVIFGLMIAAHESEWLDCRIYEVALSGGFAFSMLALAALWMALQRPWRPGVWLFLAGLAYGLAIASRPSVLFGAIILLIPVIQVFRTGSGSVRETGCLLAAAVGPVLLVVAGMMIYNFVRFGSPLEFGVRYQITTLSQQTTVGEFSPHYFGFNFRYYFWEPTQWSRHFPLIRQVPQWDPSAHFGQAQYYGGLLTVYPLVLLALAAPLAWRGRPKCALRWFVAVLFLSFLTCALTICLFVNAIIRYELDFLPALMLMSVIGVFALENNGIVSPLWQNVSRIGWCILAVCTGVTSVSGSLDSYAAANYFAGNVLVNRGSLDQAIECFHRAVAIEPGYAEAHDGLGNALFQKGRAADAIAEYERALELKPDLTEARYNLGHSYYETGRIQDSIAQNQMVLKLNPDFVKAQNDLASCFLQEGRIADALVEFRKTVKLAPDFADAHNNLGFCLLQTGRAQEAIVQFQQAVQLSPQSANFHCGLGNALLKAGHGDEAIAEYQKAVELAPDVAGIHYDLASGLLQGGRVDDAIEEYQKAVELKPDSATYHWGLASALSQKGQTNEAAAEYEKAIELQPALIEKLPGHLKR